MTALTFTVDGVALPLPRSDGPYELEYIPFGVSQRMASGALRVQFIATKYQVKINWTGLTKAERDSLLHVYGTYLQQVGVWVLPDGLTFRGLVPISSWTESVTYNPWQAAATVYDVAFMVAQE